MMQEAQMNPRVSVSTAGDNRNGFGSSLVLP